MVALAAAALSFFHGAAAAQDAAPYDELNQPLDPSAPLDPLPDLGVEWPDMEEAAGEPIATSPDTSIADAAAERSYTVRIEGLNGADLASGDVDTVSGYVVQELGRWPRVGDKVKLAAAYTLRVTGMSQRPRRVGQVFISPVTQDAVRRDGPGTA